MFRENRGSMSQLSEQLAPVYADVIRRNPGEPEFHQAVFEVLCSLGPVMAKRPEYTQARVLERLCEPERQVIFQVPWEDDNGDIQVNRAFRVEFSSALGPYKGGLRFHPSVYLGIVKCLGGAQVRTEATGYGCAIFVAEMLKARGLSLDGRRVVVSGSGNVASYAIEKVTQLGGEVVACSDSTGYLVDEQGVDVQLLKQVKEVARGRLDAYAAVRPRARWVPGGTVWEVPCEIALPCATHNEISEADAIFMVKHGCVAVGEGANMPTTPEAVQVLLEAGAAFGPGKAANAGGVAISALEMQQNAARDSWSFADSERRLEEIMRAIHDRCATTAEAYGLPGDYVAGANIAGFTRVADAMLALGVV